MKKSIRDRIQAAKSSPRGKAPPKDLVPVVPPIQEYILTITTKQNNELVTLLEFHGPILDECHHPLSLALYEVICAYQGVNVAKDASIVQKIKGRKRK